MVGIRTTEKAAKRQHPHCQRIARCSSSHKRKTRGMRRNKKPSGTRTHQGCSLRIYLFVPPNRQAHPPRVTQSHAPFFESSKDLRQSLVSNRKRQVVRHNPPVSFKAQNAWFLSGSDQNQSNRQRALIQGGAAVAGCSVGDACLHRSILLATTGMIRDRGFAGSLYALLPGL